MIQDAMRDLEGVQLHPTISEDSSLIKSPYSSFVSEIDSSVDATPGGTTPGSVEESKSTESYANSNITASPNSDLLIEFDGMGTQENSETLTPQRTAEPEQKLSFLDLSPIPKQGTFSFEDQSSDPFFQNKSATLGAIKSKQSFSVGDKAVSLDRNVTPAQSSNISNHVSTGSLLGGLNTMLQKPIPSLNSSFGLNKQNPFEIEVVEEEKFEDKVEVAEDTILTEGGGEEPEGSGENEISLSPAAGSSTEGNDSVFGDAEIVCLNQSGLSETSTRKSPTKGLISCDDDANSEALKQVKKELAEMEKRQRKKTSGAWLRGKIATGKEKMKSVKGRTKSDGQALRKNIQQRNERKLTQPQSELRVNSDEKSNFAAQTKTPTGNSLLNTFSVWIDCYSC